MLGRKVVLTSTGTDERESRETDTERLRRQALLLRRVTETANETSILRDALAGSLTAIRGSMGWQVAHGLIRASDGGLRSTGWVDHDEGYEVETDHLDPAPLLPGLTERAVTNGEPTWLALDERATHEWIAARLRGSDLTSGIAIPVITADGVGAVLEFLADHPIDLDREFVSLFREIGRQLGSVAEREHHLTQLEAVSEELRRSNEELERFAYIASHDLQEPLRKIVGFSQLLHRRYAGELDEDADEFLDYIVDGAQRLQDLIQDLLHYSRVGREDLSIETVDLAAVADDVLADQSMAIEDASAAIEVGDLPMVSGDRSKLTALLNNLVANALKFRGDAAPRIRISAQAREGRCQVTVADDGIGIDPAHRERIFEVFSRLHTRETYSGTGIGLALCRRIVERHGGRIWVEPGDDGGSAFRFTLPDAVHPPAPTAPHDEETT